MSQSQVAEAVKLPEIYVRRFLVSETAKAVLGKDFTFDTLKYPDGNEGRGNAGNVKTVPLNAATAFWVVQSTKGNEKARAQIKTAIKK